MAGRSNLTTRTLTFLYTDIEGSTRLWEQHPGIVEITMARHDQILRDAIEAHGGEVFRTVGDGLCAVFENASNSVSAALQAQRAFQIGDWQEIRTLRVRMAIHTGEVEARDGDYFGGSLNRMGRLLAVTNGGQIVLSQATQLLVLGALPPGADLLDLGEIRLRDLSYPEHVFQLLHPDLIADFPPLASLQNHPNNLPTQPGELIGREAELDEIENRLKTDSVRLLTLTGPGGTGKTRLALQAAADLIDRFPDGVYFVDLAPIRDPEAFYPAIARTIKLRESGDRPLVEALIERLKTRRMLLLLDNFEQVTAAGLKTVELLRYCPNLKLLATSREALRVRDEHVFPVPPMAMPKVDLAATPVDELAQYGAVQLFIERAQAVKPGFQLTNENAAAVAEICSRLDGLPLAIELATARLNLFSPQALLERLGIRLKLLRGGARDLPVRQQTLRDTIDWSYQLLDLGEQRLFAVLSVFQGGSFEAVEGVTSEVRPLNETGMDILDGLASLVDKNLIRQVDEEGGEPRLQMLETIREYAAERLEEDSAFNSAANQAHAAYFADFTRGQRERLLSSDQRESALGVLNTDIDNVRTAWRYWLAERNLEQLGKFIDSLWQFYEARGWYHAMIDLTTGLLQVLSETQFTPARAQEELLLQTSLARALLAVKGYTPEVEQAFTRALELSQAVGEAPQQLPVLRGLTTFYVFRGEFEKSARIGEQILSLAETYDDANMRMEGNLLLGYSLAFLDNLKLGLDHLEKGLAYYDPNRQETLRFRLGNNPVVAGTTTSALLLWMLGFLDRSQQRIQKATDLARRLNHPYTIAYVHFHSGLLHLWRREGEQALSCAETVLDIARKHDFQLWNAVGMCLYGAGLAGREQAEEGLEYIRQGMIIYQGLKTPPVFWPNLILIRAGVCGQVGQPDEGLALLEQALNIPVVGMTGVFSVEMYRLKGELLLIQSAENAPEAETWFQRALEVARKLQAPMFELQAALSLSRLWRSQGKEEQARVLLDSVYRQFSEGFTTANLKEAQEFLSRPSD
jgi:predicted ATPase/class 3 adenylate cyclase